MRDELWECNIEGVSASAGTLRGVNKSAPRAMAGSSVESRGSSDMVAPAVQHEAVWRGVEGGGDWFFEFADPAGALGPLALGIERDSAVRPTVFDGASGSELEFPALENIQALPEAGVGGAYGGVEDSRAAVKDKKAADFGAGDLEDGFDCLLRDAADGLGGIGARGWGHGFMNKTTGLDVGRHAVYRHLEGEGGGVYAGYLGEIEGN